MNNNNPVFFDESGKRQKIVDFVLLVMIFIAAFGVVYAGYYLSKINKIESGAMVSQYHPQNNSVTVLYTESNANAYAILGDKIQQIHTVLLPHFRFNEYGISTPLAYSHLYKSLQAQSSNINTDYDTYFILSGRDYVVPPAERNSQPKVKVPMYRAINPAIMSDVVANVVNADISGLYIEPDFTQINDPQTTKQFEDWVIQFKTLLNDQGVHLGLIVDPGAINDNNKSVLNKVEMVYLGQSVSELDAQIDGISKIKSVNNNIKIELPTVSTKTVNRPLTSSIVDVEYNDIATQLVGKQFNDRTYKALSFKNDSYSYKIYDAVSAYNYTEAINRIFGTDMHENFAIADPGFEEYTLWKILDPGLNHDEIGKILRSDMIAGLEISQEGAGQIYAIDSSGTPGTRDLTYDSQNNITSSFVKSNNVVSSVAQEGKNDKKIALTFDDGPDPVYTTKVLDILDSYGVKGTFFVIGENVASHPEIAREIVSRGHEIENHSFDHPVFSLLSDDANYSQIKATNDIIKTVTGVQPKFFRKPYSDSSDITNDADIRYLEMLHKLGLKASEYDVDSKDWLLNDSDKIVERVKQQLELRNGNYSEILLHDRHINPELTISALPKIIEYLRSENIQMVTVNELDHQSSNEQLQNFATSSEYRSMRMQRGALTLFTWISVVFIALSFVRYAWMIVGSIFYNIKRRLLKYFIKHVNLKTGVLPRLSIIIACYNEEKVIGRTIEALQANSYKKFRIILVNDGSKDQTAKIIQSYANNDKRITLINVPNGGKAKALEIGMSKTKSRWLVFCDADTIFAPDSLRQFALTAALDYRLGAIAAKIVVGNDNNLLTRAQLIEYDIAYKFVKASQDVTNMITVVPGAAGLWESSALIKAGGFLPDTLAEDTDTTMRVIAGGNRVGYRSNIEAYTEAPEKLTMLYKQRTRWQLGNMQAIFKHRKGVFNPKYGTLGVMGLPLFYIDLISAVTYPVILAITTVLLWSEGLFSVQKMNAIFENPAKNTLIILGLLMLVIELCIVLFVIITSKKSIKSKVKLLLTVPYYVTIYKMYLSVFTVVSLLRALRGKMYGWGHLQRTANVHIK